MSDLLKRLKRYSDPDMLFELDDFTDVADVMELARYKIAWLEGKLAQQGNYKIALEASKLARELHKERIAELEDQLRWRYVATLSKTGPEYVDDPEFPPFGETVLVKVQSATSVNYQQHALREGQGNWSWPSFGLAWLPIPTDRR